MGTSAPQIASPTRGPSSTAKGCGRPQEGWAGSSGGPPDPAKLFGTLGSYTEAFGSNTFRVSPKRSSDGQTYLNVNSHQPWEGPVTWYEAHLHSEEGLDVAGSLFPGVPCIVHGHNRNLGWVFTVDSPDLIDVYALEMNPDNPNEYLFDGRWRELEVKQVPIKVKITGRLMITVKREALWCVYGPASTSNSTG